MRSGRPHSRTKIVCLGCAVVALGHFSVGGCPKMQRPSLCPPALAKGVPDVPNSPLVFPFLFFWQMRPAVNKRMRFVPCWRPRRSSWLGHTAAGSGARGRYKHTHRTCVCTRCSPNGVGRTCPPCPCVTSATRPPFLALFMFRNSTASTGRCEAHTITAPHCPL